MITEDDFIKDLELSLEEYLHSDDYKRDCEINKEQEVIRKRFVNERFPLNKVRSMEIDDYVEGKNITYKDSFCYIIEFELQNLGQIRGTYIKPKFVIHYSEEHGKYEFQEGSKFGKDKDEVFSNVRSEIVELIEAGKKDDYDSIEKNRLSPMFKGKIYYVYYPDKTMPIYDPKHIDFFIRALGIKCDIDHTGNVEKKRLIIQWKNKSIEFSKISNLVFMNFLYSHYGFKREIDLLKNKDINSDEEPEYISNIELIDRIVLKSTESHRNPDFAKINSKKMAIGLSGEEYVLKFEKKHNKNYRNKIKRVGDDPSYGYDILSYDERGQEKHIEVKTCSQGDVDKVDFYITEHEKEKLESDSSYCIYYVCGMKSKKRKILIFKKDNLTNITFKPVAYKITAKVKED